MNYIAMASSEAGLVKQTNQDSYFAQVVSGARGKLAFAVVCDGMGGLEKGEVASASVVQAFRRWVEERLPLMDQDEIDDQSIRSEWTEIAVSFNEKLKRYGRENQLRLGTTLTALLLTDQRYYCMNIGDTRAYELTDRLTQITEDHTVIAREVELGNLTEEEARTDPRRSVLLQCIGASEEIFPDLFFRRGEKGRSVFALLRWISSRNYRGRNLPLSAGGDVPERGGDEAESGCADPYEYGTDGDGQHYGSGNSYLLKRRGVERRCLKSVP